MRFSDESPPLVTAIIPARNEEERIAAVIKEAQGFVHQVIVVDDGSLDDTAKIAQEAGAEVVENRHGGGYIGAVKTGFEQAKGDIVVTLDADGEHDPGDIPQLVAPILEGQADVVLGTRERIPRVSERFINWVANFKVKTSDSGTGFRAIKRELALKLDLKGKCTCGTFVLEANCYGARIAEVPISVRPVAKDRKAYWGHLWQVFHVLSWVLGFQPAQRSQRGRQTG